MTTPETNIILAQTTPATPEAQPGAPKEDGRSTTFQAVEGGRETRSGEALLVEAYAAIWLILMGWLFLLWRKQSGLHARLDDLEKAIDRAAAKADKADKAGG